MAAMQSSNSVSLTFDEVALNSELAKLPRRERGAFALACAYRALPAYTLWQKEYGVADFEVRRILDLLSDAISNIGENDLVSGLGGLEEEIIKRIPDESAYWSPNTSSAEHAISSAAYAVRANVSGRIEEAAWAARRAYEAADQIAVNEIAGDSDQFPDEEAVLCHPVVQLELKRQRRDVTLLKEATLDSILERARIESLLDSGNQA